MERLEHVLPIGDAVAATELRHAQAVTADKKHPVQIIGRDKVFFPVLDQTV